MSRSIPNQPDGTPQDAKRLIADCDRVNAPKDTRADRIQGEQKTQVAATLEPGPQVIISKNGGTSVTNP